MPDASAIKGVIGGLIPDNNQKKIRPADVRQAFSEVIDNAFPVPVSGSNGFILGMKSDGSGDLGYFNLTDVLRYITQGNIIYLYDNEVFRTAFDAEADATSAIQAIIDATPNNSTTALRLCYPYGSTYHGDVNTGIRTVQFVGFGSDFTTVETTDLTLGTFILGGPFSSVEGIRINDSQGINDPDFVLNLSDTRASILIGNGGSTTPRNCFLFDVTFAQPRAQGVRWAGGSFLIMDKVVFNGAGSGGMEVPSGGGDKNHFKFRNVSFSRCFKFGLYMASGGNSSGAGYFEAIKFFENQSIGFYLDGSANSGSIFVEGTNGSGEGVSLISTAGLNYLTPQFGLGSMVTLKIGSGLPNNPNFPNGTYITDLDFVNRRVYVSQNATISATRNYQIFTQRAQRNPSFWQGPNATSNVLHVVGDALDPICWRDDSAIGNNQITVGGQTYDLTTRKLRLRGSETQDGDPNIALYMTTLASFSIGSPVCTILDPTVLNRIRYGASTVTAAASNSTVISVNQVTNEVTIGSNATVSGTYMINFRPAMRGGVVNEMFDDQICINSIDGTNVGLTMFNTGRGARFVGNVLAGQPTMTLPLRIGEEIQTIFNGMSVICSSPGIVPRGTTVASFTGPAASPTSITLSNNALLDRTGVFFWFHNPSGIRNVHPDTQTYSSNGSSLLGGLYKEEVYRTVTGEMRMQVDAANDGRYEITWDPASIPALGFLALGAFTVDSNAKPLVNIGLGDFVHVSCNNDILGMQVWAQVTAANTINMYLFNPTAAAIDLPNRRYNLMHTAK